MRKSRMNSIIRSWRADRRPAVGIGTLRCARTVVRKLIANRRSRQPVAWSRSAGPSGLGAGSGGVDLFHQARLAAGRVVGVDDALAGRAVELADRLGHGREGILGGDIAGDGGDGLA